MMKLTRASVRARGAFVLEILGEPGGATPREVLERARDRVNALRERLSGGCGGGKPRGGAPPDAAAAAARKAKALEGDDGAVADSQAARGRTGWRDPQGGARGAGGASGASGRRLDAVGGAAPARAHPDDASAAASAEPARKAARRCSRRTAAAGAPFPPPRPSSARASSTRTTSACARARSG